MASFVDDSEKHHAATFVSILRALIGLIGLVATAGMTALAARYGYVTGATLFDRTAAALTFSIIALTGLVGPAVAWRLCLSSRLKPLGVLLGIISAAALVTNVTHLAAAVDKVATIGANILPPALVPASPPAVPPPTTTRRNYSASQPGVLRCTSIQHQRTQLRRHGPRTWKLMPRTAPIAANARTRNVKRSLQILHPSRPRSWPQPGIGSRRWRPKNSTRKLLAFVLVQAQSPVHRPRSNLKAPRSRNRPRSLEPTSPETASPSQIAIATAGQLAIAFSLILWGVPGRQSRAAAINQAIADIPIRAPKREPAGDGDLTLFVRDCISPAGGGSVKFRDLYLRFLDWCDEQQLSALPPQKFSQAFVKRCAEAQIEVRCEGADVVCLDVKLVPAHLLH